MIEWNNGDKGNLWKLPIVLLSWTFSWLTIRDQRILASSQRSSRRQTIPNGTFLARKHRSGSHLTAAAVLSCHQPSAFCHIMMLFDFGVKGQAAATNCCWSMCTSRTSWSQLNWLASSLHVSYPALPQKHFLLVLFFFFKIISVQTAQGGEENGIKQEGWWDCWF